MNQEFDLQGWLAEQRRSVEAALEKALEGLRGQTQPTLFEAMRYSLMAGGKRLRPILALASARAVGGRAEGAALDFACALEMVHTYSLVHDDLPAMDDDDLRRGRPTNHKVFGEAMAILAGDALLTEAFGLLASGPEPVRAQLCAALAAAAGARGMVGGQADDIRDEPGRTLEALESIHHRKTGALISVACAGGALAGGGSEEAVERLRRYGLHLGLAFQIQDDVIDVSGDPEKMGKSQGRDAQLGKATYVTLLGLEASRERARAEVRAAREQVAPLPSPDVLLALADYVVQRDH